MSRSLLVVDDDTDLLDLLSTLFRNLGYEVWTAENGEQALQRLDNHPVRIFLIDYRMKGMDGMELCRRIKQRNPAAYTICMSGYLKVFSLAEIREAGFDDVVEKPFKLEDLSERVLEAVNRLARWNRLGLRKHVGEDGD